MLKGSICSWEEEHALVAGPHAWPQVYTGQRQSKDLFFHPSIYQTYIHVAIHECVDVYILGIMQE